MDLEDLKKKKLDDLRAIAKMFGVKSVTTKNKAQLIEAMQNIADQPETSKEAGEVDTSVSSSMQQLPESKYDEIKKGFSDRLFELANSLPIHKDSFTAVDDAANMLIEAVVKFKTNWQ